MTTTSVPLLPQPRVIVVPPQPRPSRYSRWRQCQDPTCEVLWMDGADACWACGGPGELSFSPQRTNGTSDVRFAF